MALHSSRFHRRTLLGSLAGWLASLMLTSAGLAQAPGADELSEDEARQIAVAERFLTVLEKGPRRGTALDRVYGHHVEFGTLDQFLTGLRGRVNESPEDGAGWMLLGLFEAHRGEDAGAVDAFRQAEQHRPEDALASYYLGQSLLLIGQPEEAVAAFERAIERKPQRADLLEVFQQLGRVHQRAQRTEEALKVWERLEALFPDDPRVQEQIAVTLVEEGEYALALPRYEKLAGLVKDDYRRVMFQIEAAELKIRERRRDEGLRDLETMLADLNPDSWLHRDVRRRIEEVFLKSGDQDGLVKYYEQWLAGHAEDVDGMARLARFLASAARVPEAAAWMEKALKLAPSRTELRKAFIDQLVDEQRYAEAVKQYALLAESAPGNADFLRDWGKLVLKDKDQTPEARRKEAVRIWNQILATQPDDAPTTAQVADLFRQANMHEEALALYQKAVDLAPGDPQYREYLGEYYHILKRPDDARKTWESIADGPRHNAVNVARLAEIYNSFGYLEQAVVQIAEACRLDAKDFSLQLKAAEYHSRASRFDEALGFVSAADGLAASDEEREGAIKQRIDVYQSSRRLDEETEKLAAAVTGNADASADDWHLLARYFEADRRWTDATEAIERALQMDGKSVPALGTAARIAELSGDFAHAAEMNRQLSNVDRRSRSDHLMNVARLEAQMGRADEALQAGQDLIVSAPGNTDNYEFYAQLCFRLGKADEGLETLRKAVRINPTEPHLIMALGSALSEQFRTDEAIEVYWRAFEKSEELEDKTSLTMKLTELYLQVNQFDKLVERFERDRREEDKRREMTICLAQAHHTSGDYGTARQELESLLSEDTRDTNLLQQLSKLCEEGADVDAAIEYQRQLIAAAPGHESEFRLAGLLQTRGDRDESSEILVKLTRREEDPERLLRSVDSLLSQGNYESTLAITEPLLSEQRDNWELLYREGVAWASLDRKDEAADRFERLLSLNKPHDVLGVSAEAKFKQSQAKSRSDNLRGIQSQMPKRQSPLSMLSLAPSVRQAAGLDADERYYGGRSQTRVWTPEAFGMARMAAYAWLLKFEEDARTATAGKQESAPGSFVDALGERAARPDADRDTVYDWMYVEQVRSNFNSVFQFSKRLAGDGGVEEQQFYLNSLRLRGLNPNMARVSRSGETAPKKDPLQDDELELMLACYRALSKDDASNEAMAAAFGSQVIYSSTGQMYVNIGGNWVPVSGGSYGGAYLGIVVEELKLAGRDAQADTLLNEKVAQATTAAQILGAMQLAYSLEKHELVDGLYPKWVAAARDEVARAPDAAPSRGARGAAATGVNFLAGASNSLMEWMGRLGPEEEHAQILAILDAALDLAVAEGRKRTSQRSSRRRATSSPAQAYYGQMRLMYGKENVYWQVDYPRPNEYVDISALTLLREAYEVFKRNDVLADLSAHLRQRVARATAEDRFYEQLMLGDVLWWMEEQEEALELFTAAADAVPDDPTFRLEVAALREARGDYDDALAIVESITPRDQRLVQQREMTALQLAERLGDIDRARQAAERLFGLRLDNDSQLALVDRMRRLGLHDMAEAVVSRVHRRAGNQTSSLASLMALYQGQGQAELAQQIAHTILRRTTSPLSAMSTSARNPFRYRTSDDGTRTQALRLLQQTGALQPLVERLESQLAQSPGSPRLYEQLIELYQANNEREKVQTLLEQAVVQRPDALALRYQLAKQLESTGKIKEACDQYLVILKERPEWIGDDLYSVRRVFDRAQRSLDLVQAFESMNLKSFRQPYYLIDLASELMQDEKNTDMAIRLFERTFNDFPSYRNQLLSRLYDQRLWKNDKVYALGKQGVLPSASEAAANPWFGINDIYSYSSGGRVNAMFHQMLEGIKGTPKMADLQQVIEQRLAEAPAWHGGQAMLALVDLKAGRTAEAKQRLETLVADEETVKSMPSDACWIVGQELDPFEDTRGLALRLFESAAANNTSMNQMQYSPVTRLVTLYASSGRKEDARQLMLKQLRGQQFSQYDQQYAMYQRIENSVWVGNKMLELGFPVDAVRLYREMTDHPQAMQEAARWNGNQADYYANQVKSGMQKALASLDESNADEAMAQLLTGEESVKPDAAVLDLMLSAPDVKSLREKPLDSSLVNLLQTISRKPEVRDGIEKRLETLRQQHPADLSVGVTRSMYRRRMQDAGFAAALTELSAVVADNPLAEVAEGRRPNSRQRREALLSVPLWLVARECLADQQHKDLGEQLAARALEGARRQVENQYVVAILYDWGRLALEQGDRKLAEEKWSELLDLATRRPERKAPAQPDGRTGFQPVRPPARLAPAKSASATVRGDAPPRDELSPYSPVVLLDDTAPDATELIPPLTISQFRLTVEIAVSAAENGMPDLSRRAVRASLAGGIPVPDPSTLPGSMSGGRPVRSGTQVATDSSVIESEVAAALQRVLGKWQGDEYPPEEVYALLYPIVLPASRPNEILTYSDSSQLREARVESLGAALVDWSHRAGTLDDLNQRIAARQQNPQMQVPALVLQTRIALAQGAADDAVARLSELATLVDKGVLPPMVQLACHAALPASADKSLAEPAYSILKRAVLLDAQTSEQNDSSTLSLGELARRVNRHLADKPEQVREFYDTYLVGRQQLYSRYSGDYGQYLQWRDTAAIAEDAARCGVPTVALDFMGRVADFSYDRYSRPSMTTALAVICREASKLAPQARYEAWRDWTLPQAGRQTVRLAAEWVEPVVAPRGFLDTAPPSGELHSGDLLCNVTELIAAAVAAGQLDELREQVRAAYDQKLPGANYLWPLVLIGSGDAAAAEPVITELIATIAERNKQEPNQNRPDMWGDYLIYRACMESPAIAGFYEPARTRLLSALQSNAQSQKLAHVDVDFALREAEETGAAIRPGDQTLVHWVPTSGEQPTDAVPSWWVAHAGHLVHINGPGFDLLTFAYPLTGDFTFSVDCFEGGWAECDAGYGGIVVGSQMYGGQTNVWSVSRHETGRFPPGLTRNRSDFNHVDVRVTDGELQYFLNHHLVYKEPASPTSPWLLLYTDRARVTGFKNLRITGEPVIPREVPLLAGDRFDGWNTSFFGETQPRRRLMAQRAENENDSLSYEQRQEPGNFDWNTTDGVLHGAAKDDTTADAQSWIYYFRPLRDGESVRYEFFHVPGQSVAHPTIGRVALLLESDGVRAHWITRPGWDDAVLGIASDNAVTEAECRRGPAELPLKPQDWNTVELTLRGDTAVVELNGTQVYERPLEANLDRRFGLFRYKRQSTRVRSVVLTGPWPESLTPRIGNDLLAVRSPASEADRRLIGRIVGEKFFEFQPAEVVALARALTDAEAYELLKQWVLPSPDHAAFRLYYQWAPITGPEEEMTAGFDPARLLCPAVELVRAAGRSAKFPDLARALDEVQTNDPVTERGKLALMALIAIHHGALADAEARIKDLFQRVDPGLPKALTRGERAPELVVAWQALDVPPLRFVALDLARSLRQRERQGGETQSGNADWHRDVEAVVGAGDLLLAETYSDSAEPGSAGAQWSTVPYWKAETRGKGLRPSQWRTIRGAAQHLAGQTWGQLYFQSPLRGKFEIVAERSMHGWRELAIAYGMHSAEPRYDYKAKRIYKVMHGQTDVDVDLGPMRGEWLGEARIAVDGTKITTTVNNVQFHEETLTSPPDPWIVLQSATPGYNSLVHNLRILGEPEIPDEINLIDIAGWAGWRADMYGEWFTEDGADETAPWKHAGEEILGQLRKTHSAGPRESLLMYQRPMLEDGVIEFEAFYVPGEFEVHPAVGRSAFLVRPGGVSRHVLTNAEWESSGLEPDNDGPIEGAAQSVALKENDWNQYRISLAGDVVTITVNGTEGARHTLHEPPSERFFGLFRWSDKTRSRVRKLVYRGDWPKELPALADQELAYPGGGALPGVLAEGSVQEISLARPLAELQREGVKSLGPPARVTTTEAGTRLELREAVNYSDRPGLSLQRRINGDCDVTLDFDRLRMVKVNSGWGSGFSLKIVLDAPDRWAEVGVFMNGQGHQHIKTTLAHRHVDGTTSQDSRLLGGAYDSGRLRIVRQGDMVHCLYAPKDSDEFRLLESYPAGPAAIREVRIQNFGSDAAGVIDVIVNRLTLTTVAAEPLSRSVGTD